MDTNLTPKTQTELELADGTKITLHFSPGGPTLQDCMAHILSNHISKTTEI